MDRNDGTATDRIADGYDALAGKAEDDLDPAESPWGDSHFQRRYSWPATREVLPDPADCRVLLAGCGRGDHVDWFRERGATVTGVDVSETAVRRARERCDDEATFHRADLTDPLEFADDAFDLVVSNLVLSHVEEWRPVFEEFHRVLVPEGTLVASTIHPEYVRSKADATSYYATEAVPNEWPGVEIPTYYRPMEAVVTPFVAVGFRIETFDEPEPPDAYEAVHPERYRDAQTTPELLVVRARAER